MITLEDWVMIKHLHKEGVPKSRIARDLGLDRRTVDKAINEDKPPQQERQSRRSILDPYKGYKNIISTCVIWHLPGSRYRLFINCFPFM